MRHGVSTPEIAGGIEFGQGIRGVQGLVIIVDDRLGAWGEVEVVPIGPKRG